MSFINVRPPSRTENFVPNIQYKWQYPFLKYSTCSVCKFLSKNKKGFYYCQYNEDYTDIPFFGKCNGSEVKEKKLSECEVFDFVDDVISLLKFTKPLKATIINIINHVNNDEPKPCYIMPVCYFPKFYIDKFIPCIKSIKYARLYYISKLRKMMRMMKDGN